MDEQVQLTVILQSIPKSFLNNQQNIYCSTSSRNMIGFSEKAFFFFFFPEKDNAFGKFCLAVFLGPDNIAFVMLQHLFYRHLSFAIILSFMICISAKFSTLKTKEKKKEKKPKLFSFSEFPFPSCLALLLPVIKYTEWLLQRLFFLTIYEATHLVSTYVCFQERSLEMNCS